MSPARAAQVRRRWRSLLLRVKPEIHELAAQRYLFRETLTIRNQNPLLLKPNAFFRWLVANYVAAQCVGVRKQLDWNPRSASLLRLLSEIHCLPEALTAASHTRLYPRDQRVRALGLFERLFASSGGHISSRVVSADIRTLKESGSRIRRIVNKRIAHLDRPGAIRKIPTFDELDGALDVIENMYMKYHLALTGQSLTQMAPVPQVDWKWILAEPWITSAGTMEG